jgi:thiamine pyrophosphokinase
MTADLAKTNPGPADWQALDPGGPVLALVGPMDFDNSAMPADMPHLAVDGGIRHAPRPLLWLGDGDSGAMPQNIPAFLKPGQDETDLRFCLNGIRGWRWQALHLFGFLGGRKDHELANMGEIHAEMTARPALTSARFHDAAGQPALTFYNKGRHRLELRQRFSLLALEPATVSIDGDCAYPARSLALPVLSGQGVSNIGHGMVAIEADKPFSIIL